MAEGSDIPLDIPPYADWSLGRWKGRETTARQLIEERLATLFNRAVCRADSAGWQTIASIVADKHCGGLQSYLQSFGGPFDISTLNEWPRTRWCNLAIQLASVHVTGLKVKSLSAYPDRDLPEQAKWGVRANAIYQQNVLAELARTVCTSDRQGTEMAARSWLETVWKTGVQSKPRMPDVREREITKLAKVIRNRALGAKRTRHSASAPESPNSPKPEALSLLSFINGDRWNHQRQPP